jgi:hypothetical protein
MANSPYQTHVLGLEKQRETARKLREGALEPLQGQMVGGWHVAPQWSQYAAQMLRAYQGAKQDEALGTKLDEMEAQRTKADEDLMTGFALGADPAAQQQKMMAHALRYSDDPMTALETMSKIDERRQKAKATQQKSDAAKKFISAMFPGASMNIAAVGDDDFSVDYTPPVNVAAIPSQTMTDAPTLGGISGLTLDRKLGDGLGTQPTKQPVVALDTKAAAMYGMDQASIQRLAEQAASDPALAAKMALIQYKQMLTPQKGEKAKTIINPVTGEAYAFIDPSDPAKGMYPMGIVPRPGAQSVIQTTPPPQIEPQDVLPQQSRQPIKPVAAPQSRSVTAGDRTLTQEWDGRQWVTTHSAPRVATEQTSSEGERKAGTYQRTMQGAEQTITNIEADGFNPLSTKSQADLYAAGNGLTNFMASPKAQQYMQAQREWSEAWLRAKTGAAATADEVQMNIVTYFPQVGDSADVVKQKKLKRAEANRNISVQAGRSSAVEPRMQEPVAQPTGQTIKEGTTATGPGGGKIVFRGGKWIPMTGGR